MKISEDCTIDAQHEPISPVAVRYLLTQMLAHLKSNPECSFTICTGLEQHLAMETCCESLAAIDEKSSIDKSSSSKTKGIFEMKIDLTLPDGEVRLVDGDGFIVAKVVNLKAMEK